MTENAADAPITPVMEDYLTAIYKLQTETDEPVWTTDVADALAVTAPTVSSMFETLSDRGLITREKHRPVTLTERGETIALRIVRNHRLLETFLVERLGYEWHEVHEEADRLEHHLSDRLATQLWKFIGKPTVDPHGDPIPDGSLPPTSATWPPLTSIADGTRVRVERVRATDDELEYLDEVGVRPSVTLTVTAALPIGLYTVDIDGTTQQLPTEIADRIFVAPIEERAE
ncbi:metal-dependent transcriptional regulator [Natrialba taiwanensis]|uniref:Transcription regulator n=1 Tax=Natrialba taiwanensis DSM 12281 TaxID=1230458 RepID=M0A206_9EURY|nr:metal-dependent transcriptional regulator [Natrialba taiwanensis]ELY92634.1 transcription regulator [Natrialba taiwanensis DSM 12281]